MAEKERFGLRPRLRCPKLLCSLPLRAISTAAPSFRSLLPPLAALPHSSLLPVPGARSNLSLPNEKAPLWVLFHLAEKERFGLRPRLRCPKLLCSLPLRAISTAAPSHRSLLPPPAALPHSSLLPVPGARSNLSMPNKNAPLWGAFLFV